MEQELNSEANKDKTDKLMILYQLLLKDIQFYKNQQWLSTYYVFGIYVFLSTVIFQLDQKADYWMIVPVVRILSFFVMLGGAWILWMYKDEIEKSKYRKNKVLDSLPDLREILPHLPNNESRLKEITYLLMGAMAVGWVFVYLLSFSGMPYHIR